MEKILELAQLCIGNRTFYTGTGAMKIKASISYNKNCASNTYMDASMLETYEKSYNKRYEIISKIEDTLKLRTTWLPAMEYCERLTIIFVDEPSIIIDYEHVMYSESINADSIKISTGNIFKRTKKYFYKYKFMEYEYRFFVRCGFVKTYITKEEYLNLVKSYYENCSKFLMEADLAKIDARLAQFK